MLHVVLFRAFIHTLQFFLFAIFEAILADLTASHTMTELFGTFVRAPHEEEIRRMLAGAVADLR